MYKREVKKYPVSGKITIKTPEWANLVESFSEKGGPKLSSKSQTLNFGPYSKE
ncbi:MAG: hypothetical protein NDF55_09420 [archaeon GB-1867-005]|nr:hypothetical protein [Candidatus Culexmicrobium cathedralense]